MVEKFLSAYWLLAQATESSNKLPPPTRAAALMALLGILLLGMLLVVFILVGGHWVRRWGTHRRGPAVPPDLILSPPTEDDTPAVPPMMTKTDLSSGDTFIADDTRL